MAYAPFIALFAAMVITCARKPRIDPKTLEQRYIDSVSQACRDHGGYMLHVEKTNTTHCEGGPLR